MEKENFDEELKNRIKQIFDDYPDGTADEGWNRLREKFPEKNRRDFMFWWLAAAAVLLLGILLFWFSSSNIQNTNSKIAKHQPKEAGSKRHNIDSVFKDETSKQNLASTKTLAGTKITSLTNIKETPIKTASSSIENRLSTQSQKTELAETKPKNQAKAETTIQRNTVFTGIKKASVADSAAKKREAEIASSGIASSKNQQEMAAQKAITTKSVKADSLTKNQQFSVKKSPVNSSAFVDSAEKKQQQLTVKSAKPIIKKPVAVKKAEPAKKLSEEKPSKFSLGLFAGAHLNYAKGSTNQLGLGAGVSTDFRIAKNLKFSTGLGLLQNNLSYGQTIPASSQLAASNFTAMSAVNNSIQGLQTSNLKSMDARLLALDVPLNLTYIILPGKNSISFSAGLSSNTFVREVYNYHYVTVLAAVSPGVNASTGTTQNLQSSKRFSNFNFAKTLNLSAGFAYPLGKNKLQVEPFLKYPLGGMGSQKLLLGSAGINLKMNFSNVKK